MAPLGGSGLVAGVQRLRWGAAAPLQTYNGLSEDLQLHPNRQAQIILRLERPVADLVDQIEVAGAQLVEEGDGLVPPSGVLQLQRYPFSDESMEAHPRREPIVAVGILVRLFAPEFPIQ